MIAGSIDGAGHGHPLLEQLVHLAPTTLPLLTLSLRLDVREVAIALVDRLAAHPEAPSDLSPRQPVGMRVTDESAFKEREPLLAVVAARGAVGRCAHARRRRRGDRGACRSTLEPGRGPIARMPSTRSAGSARPTPGLRLARQTWKSLRCSHVRIVRGSSDALVERRRGRPNPAAASRPSSTYDKVSNPTAGGPLRAGARARSGRPWRRRPPERARCR